MTPFIGIAGWSIPRENASFFPITGSHLERYASVFNTVEINSSFYRDHLAKSYERWSKSVPGSFLFAVKVSRRFTHEKKLRVTREELKAGIEPILHLGKKLGILLVQLPPSLSFQKKAAEDFFAELRLVTDGAIACEPRHNTWLTKEARDIFATYSITKVIADPAPCLDVTESFHGLGRVNYFRLHGSPEMYRSSYGQNFLQNLSERLDKERRNSWVIFDNTALFQAIPNAQALKKILALSREKHYRSA